MQNLAEIRRSRSYGTISRKRKLPLPPSAGIRVAQVSARPAIFDDSRYFSVSQTELLQTFRPQVLVGSAMELEALAQEVSKGLELASIDHAVIVVTDCRDVPVREACRELLWRVFGVPVFEFLLGGDGSPIASECDAHEGWHVEDGVTFSSVDGQLWFKSKKTAAQGTGLTGLIESGICPCGQPGLRILNAAIDYRDPVRHSVARTA